MTLISVRRYHEVYSSNIIAKHRALEGVCVRVCVCACVRVCVCACRCVRAGASLFVYFAWVLWEGGYSSAILLHDSDDCLLAVV